MSLANRNAPFGFILFHQGGKMGVHRVRRRAASGRSKTIMPGDAYTVLADGSIIRVVDGNVEVHGVCEGPELNEPLFGMESNEYIAAADEGYIIGIEDPSAVFRVQASGDFQLTNINDNCDLVDADGSTLLAQSRQAIDSGTLGSGNQFKVVDLVQAPADNAVGNYAHMLVRGLQMLG